MWLTISFFLLCLFKGVAKGEEFFDDKQWLCEFVASMCLTACFCAFLSLTLLTLSRYVYLCHNQLYDKLFNRGSCIVMCVMCWATAFMFEFPNFIGWGGHYFDKKNHQCIWDRTASMSYTMFVSIGLIGGPLVLMAICYFLIFQQIWETKRDIYKLDSDNPMRMRKAWNETVRSSKTLFCIFIVFVVFWTPYAVTVALDVQDNLSTELHLFVTLLAHLHSSVNCIIYAAGNKKFRKGIMRLFGCRQSTKSSFSSNPDVTTKRTNSSSSTSPSLNSDSYHHANQKGNLDISSSLCTIGSTYTLKKWHLNILQRTWIVHSWRFKDCKVKNNGISWTIWIIPRSSIIFVGCLQNSEDTSMDHIGEPEDLWNNVIFVPVIISKITFNINLI